MDPWKHAGFDELKAGNFYAASGLFSQAIQNDATMEEHLHIYYSARSGAYYCMQQYDEAMQDAEQCTKLRPSWAKGYSRKGAALFKLGRAHLAKEAYVETMRLDPTCMTLSDSMRLKSLERLERQAKTNQEVVPPPPATHFLRGPSGQKIFTCSNGCGFEAGSDDMAVHDAVCNFKRDPHCETVHSFGSDLSRLVHQYQSLPATGARGPLQCTDVVHATGYINSKRHTWKLLAFLSVTPTLHARPQVETPSMEGAGRAVSTAASVGVTGAAPKKHLRGRLQYWSRCV
jgi:hypothetical protein